MSVQKLHPEYEDNYPLWKKVRDVVKGEDCLKKHDLSCIPLTTTTTSVFSYSYNPSNRYLIYTSNLPSDEAITRYRDYVLRASFTNVTARTEAAVLGMVKNKESVIELPESLEYMLYNADGTGIGIEEMTNEIIQDVLETGRCGLLVDFPQVDNPLTVEQMGSENYHATIIKYAPEHILDWDTVVINATKKLSFVKLCETISYRDPNDIFNLICCQQYRVLTLEDGVCVVNVYDDKGGIIEGPFILHDADGLPLTFIPFFFIGSTDNRPDCDKAPLLDIANLNIAHYRDSADFNESCYLVGQPTLFIAGLDQQWITENYSDGITFGSRQGLVGPPGSSAQLLQADPNTMAKQGMDAKMNDMIKIGARLITDGGQAETATAARIKHSADTSVVKGVIKNVSNAINEALYTVMLFNGSVEEFTFELNTDFYTDKLSAQEIAVLVSAWVQGGITEEELRESLTKNSVIGKKS